MIHFFTDPVLRAPTLGSMLMCLASSLVGVIVFLRKKSLVGEALSHAAYPGVVISVLFASFFSEEVLPLFVLGGAFLSAILGLKCIDLLQRKCRVSADAALCFVLSVFFGVGIVVASHLQTTHALWLNQAQLFLFGQAATMTDIHIVIYALLALLIIGFILFFYRHIEAVNFDRPYAATIRLRCQMIDNATFLLLALAIVIGIRSVGVVLMAGMLIAPAAAARLFSKRLSHHFILAALFGVCSGFVGNAVSSTLLLPTGPTILLSASCLCILALLFAPKKGLCSRFLRRFRYRRDSEMENALKTLWKGKAFSGSRISHFTLRLKGWVTKELQLTDKGRRRAEKIVRLHRLWEVYLVDYMGQKAEKVHRNAEELEHLMTPELEAALTLLLNDPKLDPHQQPIPPR